MESIVLLGLIICINLIWNQIIQLACVNASLWLHGYLPEAGADGGLCIGHVVVVLLHLGDVEQVVESLALGVHELHHILGDVGVHWVHSYEEVLCEADLVTLLVGVGRSSAVLTLLVVDFLLTECVGILNRICAVWLHCTIVERQITVKAIIPRNHEAHAGNGRIQLVDVA